MEIVIAKNELGYVVGIVAARTKELATAYWHGTGLKYNTTQTLEEMQIEEAVNNNPSGVVPILKTIDPPMGGYVRNVPLVTKR